MTEHQMNETEIRTVYAVAMAYDNRKLSEANITAWWEQAIRNRWTLDDAREAIHEHHRTSTDFLMPAHITAIIRASRRQPQRFDRAQLPAAPPAPDSRVQSILTELAHRLRWNRGVSQSRRDPALSVQCPHSPCRAAVGVPCAVPIHQGTHKGETRQLSNPHPSRVEAAGGPLHPRTEETP